MLNALPFSCFLWVLGENNTIVANAEKTEVWVPAGALGKGCGASLSSRWFCYVKELESRQELPQFHSWKTVFLEGDGERVSPIWTRSQDPHE